MVITIAKLRRELKEGTSKKTGKAYSFESFGIAPQETKLMDINGDEFERNDRWINGSSVKGVTDNWSEGDKVKVNLVRVVVKARDGSDKEVINFRLPEGVEPMVQKFKVDDASQSDVADPDDF